MTWDSYDNLWQCICSIRKDSWRPIIRQTNVIVSFQHVASVVIVTSKPTDQAFVLAPKIIWPTLSNPYGTEYSTRGPWHHKGGIGDRTHHDCHFFSSTSTQGDWFQWELLSTWPRGMILSTDGSGWIGRWILYGVLSFWSFNSSNVLVMPSEKEMELPIQYHYQKGAEFVPHHRLFERIWSTVQSMNNDRPWLFQASLGFSLRKTAWYYW